MSNQRFSPEFKDERSGRSSIEAILSLKFLSGLAYQRTVFTSG